MTSTVRLRPSVLAAREKVRDALTEAKRLHTSGLESLKICSRLSAVVDGVLSELFASAASDLSADGGQALRTRIALVAIGGYGRRQLAPYSDVDLMILHTGRLDEEVRALASRLTQDLYDAGLRPGHSVREVAEAVRLAKGDTVICTSLIESRLVVGSLPAFEEFKSAFQQMVERGQKKLCLDFIVARQDERQKYGDTVFLLEPNVKRSPGGLRDLHLLRWLWYAKSGESDPNRLLSKGVISKFEHRRMMSSQSFLLHVRNEMHFSAGNANDVLDRAEQMRIAEVLKVRAREGMLPVEHFMRDYFRHTSHVSFFATRLCDLSSPAPVVQRMLDPVLSQSISSDFRVGMREIAATQLGTAKLKNRLSKAVRLVDLARVYGKRISQETWYHVYRSAPNYSTDLEELTIQRFCGLLENPLGLEEALRRMHELGILEKIIPDYSHARCLLQFNRYHQYTVDEHCIRAVGEATRLGDRSDLAGETYRGLQRKWLLHLVMLLHDLGKGYTEDHCIRGIEIAHRIGERLQIDPDATELAANLIRDHLLMAHAAFRRDTSDVNFVKQFASEVGDIEQLDMLYLLTLADLAAVGPGVLNDWKAEVLGDLYRRMRGYLGDTRPAQEEESQRTSALKQAVWSQLEFEERKDPWFEAHYLAFPLSFVTSHDATELAGTLRRLRSLQPFAGAAWGRNLADSKVVEFIAGVDQGQGRGIFSAMAGVLSSRGMSIVAADTTFLDNSLLLLRYQVADTQTTGPTPESRLQEIAKELVAAIDSDEPPKFKRIWGSEQSEASSSLTDLPIEVRLNEEISQECLVVEVFAFDHLGLLYQLARALHDLRFNIRFAKLSTSLDQLVAVFYVTERDRSKPAGTARMEKVRSQLQAIIDPPEAESTP